MNIFEQYGIQQVADVTLYAITYNKYGEEIYVPIIYFDTLKVSNIEESAEQAVASGGRDNSEQVYWNYGKQLKVSLTDALYTPASQSLLWGGRLGLKNLEINGKWYPRKFTIKKIVSSEWPLEGNTTQGTPWVGFYCPCDEKIKFMTYQISYDNQEDSPDIEFQEVTFNNEAIQIENNTNLYSCQIKDNKDSSYDKILIKNFINFSESDQKSIITNRIFQWEDCEIEISSNENLIGDNITIGIFSNENVDNKSFYFKDSEGIWRPHQKIMKIINKKIEGFDVNKVDTTFIPTKNITKNLFLSTHIGTFYIIEKWNIGNTGEESGIHSIDVNIKQNRFLNRFEKHYAKKDFKIDTDLNIKAYNAFKDKKYDSANLVSYIDPKTMMPYTPNEGQFIDNTQLGNSYKIFKQGEYYLKYVRSQRRQEDQEDFQQTVIRAQDYASLFKLVGETCIRDRYGEDRHYQIEICRCRLDNGLNLQLSSDGEAATVDFALTAMSKEDGTIARLTSYKITEPKRIILQVAQEYSIEIIHPINNGGNGNSNPAIYCVPIDCRILNYGNEVVGVNEYEINSTYLRLPTNSEVQKYKDNLNDIPKEILLVAIRINNSIVDYLTQENCKKYNAKITIDSGSDI